MNEAAVVLAGVRKRFGALGDPPLLDGIDLTLARGETFGLIGPAGAGKSVLMKIVCRLVMPDAARSTSPRSRSACSSRTTRSSTS